MSCKSLITVANTGSQTVNAGGTLNLGSILRRHTCGCPSLDLNGNGVTITEPGYYLVDAKAVVTPAEAGTITMTLLENGVAVPDGVATATTSTAGQIVTLNINTPVVRQLRHCSGKTLALQLSAAAIVTNASMRVVEE